eukprot:TRINITY_DN151_c5_g1_i2.p1 TRINITY_DN151_c5_g1~~TRINITY_DN151_c5_g1_i2.p1  ORF type:complete len:620 (-),score=155.75 TRINITY_DN151_c5_g1_i2:1801-3609(-)
MEEEPLDQLIIELKGLGVDTLLEAYLNSEDDEISKFLWNKLMKTDEDIVVSILAQSRVIEDEKIRRKKEKEKEKRRKREKEAKEEESEKEKEKEIFFLKSCELADSKTKETIVKNIIRFRKEGWTYPFQSLCAVCDSTPSLERILRDAGCLFVRKGEGVKFGVTAPSAKSQSQSCRCSAGAQNVPKYVQVQPSFHHVFASFISEMNGCIEPTPASLRVANALSLCRGEGIEEILLSSNISCVLSEFFHGSQSPFRVVHQYPSGKQSTVDIGVVNLSGISTRLVSVAEVKRTLDERNDENQLLGYFSHFYDHKKISGPFLGLLIYPSRIHVYGAVVRVTEDLPMLLLEDYRLSETSYPVPQLAYCKLASVADETGMGRFFDTYMKYVGVFDGMCSSSPRPFELPCPLNEDWLDKSMLGDNVMKFLDKEKERYRVCKFYDYHGRDVWKEDQRDPNLDIIKILGEEYLGSMEVVTLVEGSVQCLLYDFVGELNKKPNSIEQFMKVCKDVQKLHAAGYVHGDVRCANMAFGDKDDEAWLLDFDFSGKENEKVYPSGWNKDLQERHRSSRQGALLHPSHDRYSLGIVYRIFFVILILAKENPVHNSE